MRDEPAEVGREYLLEHAPAAAAPRKILVVGAGPDGLYCARLLTLRGHRVVVLEERDRAGGALFYAAKAPGRSELWELTAYLMADPKRLEVEIRLDTALAPGLVGELKPDAAVVATGAAPRFPKIPGLLDSGLELSTDADALSGAVAPGARVAVLGSDQAAMVAADFLAQAGRQVAVLGGAHIAPELAPTTAPLCAGGCPPPG